MRIITYKGKNIVIKECTEKVISLMVKVGEETFTTELGGLKDFQNDALKNPVSLLKIFGQAITALMNNIDGL